MLLKLYVYGYMNRIQSRRRLERECQRNIELMWLTGRLAPDFKTIVDFRRDNGLAICGASAQFIVICRDLGLFTRPPAAIDGGKFKSVNARDKNFTRSKVRTRLAKLGESTAQYLTALDAADRQENMDGSDASGSGKLRDKLHSAQGADAEIEGSRGDHRGLTR